MIETWAPIAVMLLGAMLFLVSIRASQLLSTNGAYEDQIRELRAACDILRSQFKTCTSNNADLANKLLAANTEIDTVKKVAADKSMEIIDLINTIGSRNADIADKDKQIEELTAERDRYYGLWSEDCKKVQSLNAKLDAKASECRDLMSRLDQSVRERGEVVAANTKLHAELRNVKEASGILNAMHQEALDRNEELMAEVDELKKRLSDTQTLKNQTQEQLDSYAALSDELKEQLAAASGSCDYLLGEVDSLKNQVAGLQDECSRLWGIVGQRNASLIDCKLHAGKLAAVLQEWHVDYEGQVSTLDVDTPDGKPWGPFSKADFAAGEAK